MKQFTYHSERCGDYYLWTQSTSPPLQPATIHFLSKNTTMPDTVQASELPEGKVIVENPFTGEPKVYDAGEEPRWS